MHVPRAQWQDAEQLDEGVFLSPLAAHIHIQFSVPAWSIGFSARKPRWRLDAAMWKRTSYSIKYTFTYWYWKFSHKQIQHVFLNTATILLVLLFIAVQEGIIILTTRDKLQPEKPADKHQNNSQMKPHLL